MFDDLEAVGASFDEEVGIARIRLERPEKLNAMNATMVADLVTVFEDLTTLDGECDGVAIRAAIIEGEGDQAFSAGADVEGFGGSSPADFWDQSSVELPREFPAPVVAKIDGYCLGGGFELALGCDFRIASDRSTFGFPEVDLGLIPGGGGIHFAAALSNPSTVMEFAMTGERLSAERSKEMELINAVHPASELDAAVDHFVHQIADQPPLAIRAIKDAGRKAVQLTPVEGQQYDRRVLSALLQTEDFEEGVASFSDDNHEPTFVGR